MYYPEDPSTYDDPSTRLAKLTSIIERIVSSSDQISNDTYSHKSGVDGSGFPSSVPEEANEETNISLHLY